MNLPLWRNIKLSNRARAIALGVVGSFLFILFLFAFWQRYLVDSLVQYAPVGTVAYVHFSLPQKLINRQVESLLSLALKQNGLVDLNLNLVDREVAFVGVLETSGVQWLTIIKTDQSNRLRQYLEDNKIKYRYLSGGKFAVANNTDWLKKIKKEKKVAVTKQLKNNLSGFATVAVAAKNNFFIDDLIGKTLFSKLAKTDWLFLNLKAQSVGLVWQISKGGNGSIEMDDWDVALNVKNLKNTLIAWQENKAQLESDLADEWRSVVTDMVQSVAKEKIEIGLLNELLSGQVSLVAKQKATTTSWWLTNFNFIVKLDWVHGQEQSAIEALEKILQRLVGSKVTKKSVSYLLDGTRMTELRPDYAKLAFSASNSFNCLATNWRQQPVKLCYRIEGQKVIITNQDSDVIVDWQDLPMDFMVIGTKYFDLYGYDQYLKVFDRVEFTSGRFILR